MTLEQSRGLGSLAGQEGKAFSGENICSEAESSYRVGAWGWRGPYEIREIKEEVFSSLIFYF